VNRCWADKPKDRPDFGHCLKVLETCKKERLPRVPDKMPEWKMEVVAPETIKAEKEPARAPVTQPAENERTTTSVPITKHRYVNTFYYYLFLPLYPFFLFFFLLI
jgi:hypothetical protein